MRIPYARPSIGEAEVALVLDAVSNGWGSERDKHVELFQSEFASYVGTDYAIATSSCTGALHLGLAGIGIGPGDEIILADTNWIATLAPIVYLGATPVLVDITSDIWCIDPDRVSAAITPRTKAVIATHLYGNVADIKDLQRICEHHDLWLVEDAAEGVGSRYGVQHVGSMGDFGVFSFHGSKTITTGEGGMIVTDDAELYERTLTLSNHGRSRFESRLFWPERIGFKYKMSSMQAALGVAQLRRVDDLVAEKQDTLRWLNESLADIDRIRLNPSQPGRVSGAWMPTIEFCDLEGASETVSALRLRGIDARPVFAPLSGLRVSESRYQNSSAQAFHARAFNVPSPAAMNCQERHYLLSILRPLLQSAVRDRGVNA